MIGTAIFISGVQQFPKFVRPYIAAIRNAYKRAASRDEKGNRSCAEDIAYFPARDRYDKRALITLSPEAWHDAVAEYPNIRRFNYNGFTYEMVRVLNERGYVVDIIDYRSSTFSPSRKYDLFIGHSGYCTSAVEAMKKAGTPILQYVSGAYWEVFLRQSQERYDQFCARKDMPRVTTFKRAFNGTTEGEEFLTSQADYCFTADCRRMVETYGEYKNKFRLVGWAAYLEEDLLIQERDFDKGRRSFIYVAGTSGNIQKGLDLMLETFIRTPDLHLYIYCDVEDEILSAYRRELALPNIHYIYHYRFGPLRRRLREIFKTINFTISAPIDTGIGTAYIGSMGLGFIPVGYIDMDAPAGSSVLTDSCDIDSLVKCVTEASLKTPEWCRKASELSKANFRENWSVESFRNKFDELLKLFN